MKILHIGKYFPPFYGGIENFMAHLLPVLNKFGLLQVALVHQHKPGLSSVDVYAEARVYRASCFGSVFFAPLSPWFFIDLFKVLKKEKPTILHLHMPNTSVFWALFLPSARKLPWIVHWHSDVVGDRPREAIRLLYPLYRIFESWVLRRAHTVICTSPNYLKTSKPLSNFKEKCVVIPLGLPVDDQKPESEQCLPKQHTSVSLRKALRVLVVGRFSYYKGHRFLIDALALLPKDCEIEVVFVGKGELATALEKQVSLLKLSSVKFVGAVSDADLENWYRWCDCICLPSIERTEAFGMVILEAARYGKPAIVTDVPGAGMSWVVQHNITGWVVPTADSGALAKRLNMLCSKPELTTVAGTAAYQRFLDCFSINKVAEKTAELYHAALNTKHK